MLIVADASVDVILGMIYVMAQQAIGLCVKYRQPLTKRSDVAALWQSEVFLNQWSDVLIRLSASIVKRIGKFVLAHS